MTAAATNSAKISDALLWARTIVAPSIGPIPVEFCRALANDHDELIAALRDLVAEAADHYPRNKLLSPKLAPALARARAKVSA